MKFTMETETLKQLPFLDIFISNVDSNLTLNDFHKGKNTGLLWNYTIFNASVYKIGLFKSLVKWLPFKCWKNFKM